MVQEPLDLFVSVIAAAHVDALDEFVEIRVNHIEIGHVFFIGVVAFLVVLPIAHASDAHLSEDHAILSKCACLVSQNIRNLTKLLGEGRGVHFWLNPFADAVHADIPSDEASLNEFDELKSHNE